MGIPIVLVMLKVKTVIKKIKQSLNESQKKRIGCKSLACFVNADIYHYALRGKTPLHLNSTSHVLSCSPQPYPLQIFNTFSTSTFLKDH